MSINEKVKVIPCSGMGKVFGLMAREAALRTVGQLCPDKAETMCLAYVVTGDAEAEAGIDGKPCITIDGCPKMCSAKSVAIIGGDIKEEFKVLDIMKEHKGAQPGTATELTTDGWTIVDKIAATLHERVQQIHGEGR
ncbi:putative zinc-binding protein [Anaeroselena agilis]|uniref:Zinc-binding protein n=1 Tax=Anaeroselena agilis TaxID=3063788 RepID=A0ABU3NU37_9FIRM|nr:putative zinc-binding protein [Selenomonadales bacterium 4137-cl]